VNPGRSAAAQALLDVERGEHAEDALARLAPADTADRALAWHLVFGVLRQRSALDELIRIVARRGVRTLDAPVLAALRVGLFELRYSRVPPHAAVDQAVELARALGVGHAAGFVNAVLRRQGEHAPPDDALLGHPDWLVRRWRARHGAEAADAWMRANNEPAPVYLCVKDDPAGVSRAFQHAGLTLAPVTDDVFLAPRGAGAVDEWPGFAEGRWWVMDPAAAAVADLAGLVDGVSVLDTCAAPGGKSFRLAARGARVTATDVDEVRIARMREGAERLGLALQARVHDWEASPAFEGGAGFDVVVVDAPCTGLGTLRRHPDIRWRRQESDIALNAARQQRILAHAARAVRPGGALVYAVCSPEPEEGADVAATLGWPIEARFENAPATSGADVFQGYRLRAPGGPAR
jgi:16S rRNA (cytosine967-C5)-methyltransferase